MMNPMTSPMSRRSSDSLPPGTPLRLPAVPRTPTADQKFVLNVPPQLPLHVSHQTVVFASLAGPKPDCRVPGWFDEVPGLTAARCLSPRHGALRSRLVQVIRINPRGLLQSLGLCRDH